MAAHAYKKCISRAVSLFFFGGDDVPEQPKKEGPFWTRHYRGLDELGDDEGTSIDAD
jgi:hypothetical protein